MAGLEFVVRELSVLVRYSRQQELRYKAFAPHEAFSAIIK
jgi:hypothetical protein